jgi:16S rRNA (guanine527-N7)-methyltransferase
MNRDFATAYDKFGVPGGLPPEAREAFAAWHDLLTQWNRKVNLTRVVAAEQAVIYHLLDSVPLARALSAGVRLLDVGSGAGVPGLIVATLRPDVQVTCAESVTKKASFMIQAQGAMQLGNVRVVDARAETLHDTFDAIAARAVAGPAELAERFGKLLAPGGRLALFLTPQTREPVPPGYVQVEAVDYSLPGGYGERRLVLVEKQTPLD